MVVFSSLTGGARTAKKAKLHGKNASANNYNRDSPLNQYRMIIVNVHRDSTNNCSLTAMDNIFNTSGCFSRQANAYTRNGPDSYEKVYPIPKESIKEDVDLKDLGALAGAYGRVQHDANAYGSHEGLPLMIDSQEYGDLSLEVFCPKVKSTEVKQFIIRLRVQGDEYEGSEFHHVGCFLDEKASPSPRYVIVGGEESALYAKASPKTIIYLFTNEDGRRELEDMLSHPFNKEGEQTVRLTFNSVVYPKCGGTCYNPVDCCETMSEVFDMAPYYVQKGDWAWVGGDRANFNNRIVDLDSDVFWDLDKLLPPEE